ncbi:MAG: GNAT family N-acetyltransferase [Cytophagaceae bacterium]|nr:MAG: GNAT family N-acetyltransferase [Cytophagaceae bacterium]
MHTTQLSTSDGNYIVRQAESGDASSALEFFKRVRSQSPYLLLELDEGIQDTAVQERQFRSMQLEHKQAVFLALHLEKVIGFAGISRGVFKRNAHSASIAVAVDTAHQRCGVGSLLMQAVFSWAHEKRLTRVELTVATENAAAIKLYERHDFVTEGTKRKSFRIGERLVDEQLMARVFDGLRYPDRR